LLALAALACPVAAESLRLAYFHTELERRGPGLLLRDILRGDPQVAAVAGIVAEVAPDVLVLGAVDWDLDGHALEALAARIAEAGHDLPHRFTARPNTGLATGRDMDGDGRLGEPEDAQGFGAFPGQGGMAVLSRFPLDVAGLVDFSALRWADLPGAISPREGAEAFPDDAVFALQRLSTTVHWDLPVRLPGGPLRLLIFHATPPVFDGPEDRNGRRNHDEAALWLRYLEGALAQPPPEGPLAIIGTANLDVLDGDGRAEAMRALLTHPRLQDPAPRSAGGAALADPAHRGDPALDTADWNDAGPGNLRVDYILPSVDLAVTGAGIHWPAPGTPEAARAERASRHRMVWVDLEPQGSRGSALAETEH
jgi:hypothetical protein